MSSPGLRLGPFVHRKSSALVGVTVLALTACEASNSDQEMAGAIGIEQAAGALVATDVDGDLGFAQQQILKAENRLADTAHPRVTPTDGRGGQWATAARTDWRSGFFNGSEWLLLENYGTNANSWLSKAQSRMADFSSEVGRTQTHDVGFKTILTYGNGYRLTNTAAYRDKIFAGANTLAARFLPQYGVTRSWDDTNGDVRVIVDNMMNLEVLFMAAALTSNTADRDRWLNIAVSHAKKTEQNQVRDSADPNVDGSTCHVYFYNLGVCRTKQGLSDSSTWARGQTWVMYGFTMAYQYARNYAQYAADADLFLATAQRTSDLYLRRLAEPKHGGDWVPLHDFDAPAGYPKDSSAAAVAASALLELSRIPAVPPAKREEYQLAAERTLESLRDSTRTKPYRETATATDTSRESILLRATTTYKGPGDSANTDVEKSLSYADFYFLEALLRWKDMYGGSPRKPDFLAANANPSGVTLAWRSTRGAAVYNVKRATSASGAYTTLGQVADPGYFDTTAVAGTPYWYAVSAVNQAQVETPNSNQATATVPAPSIFTGTNLGSVAAAGSFSQAAGVYTVKGSGADIWGTADAGFFVYQSMTGNATITARITSLGDTNATAKAGVMIRESLAAGAKNAFAHLTPTTANGFRAQVRTATNGTTARTNTGTGSTGWVRVVRSGNTLTSYWSADGANFAAISAGITITMAATVYVGLAVTSHADGTLTTATFDNVSVGP
jgi:unsaturated chondroitin disaccharide hydrolase